MFTEYNILVNIGNLDNKTTAPLIGVIIFILNIIYIQYLISPCNHAQEQFKKITFPIYIISVILSVIGIIAFIIRRKLVKKGTAYSSSKDISLYITGHTLFHYMIYTGAMLLFLLFYIENKAIFLSIFAPDSCSDGGVYD